MATPSSWPRLEAAVAQQQTGRHTATSYGDGSGTMAAWASAEGKEEGQRK